MKTIWVVEKGEYSDYGVVGVFDSKENAQRVADLLNTGEVRDEATVSEWPLNPCIEHLNAGRKPYGIIMDYNGNTERIYPAGFAIDKGLEVWKRTEALAYEGMKINDAVSGIVWANDEKHAVKIANEFRVQAIAKNEMKTRK